MQKSRSVNLNHLEDAIDIVNDGSLRREHLLVKFLVGSLNVPSLCDSGGDETFIGELTTAKLCLAAGPPETRGFVG